MNAEAGLLTDASRCGVYQLNRDARQVEKAAVAAGLAVWRVDIGHAHDKEDFLRAVAAALSFPRTFGGNWDALADCLRDLSWVKAKGFVLILEKSKHFSAAHRHEFDEAVDILNEATEFWRGEGTPFWGLVSGPEGWQSGCPQMPPA